MKIKVLFVSMVVALIAFCLFLSGCANSTANLQRETAREIGGNLRPSDVEVSNINRGALEVTWQATTPKGAYDCFADDMLRRINCVPVKNADNPAPAASNKKKRR